MKKGVTVFGSFNADLTGRCKGLPVPGETLKGSAFQMGPGGKGSNQATAAHRAGADVTLITKVGADVFGGVARSFYEREGMKTDAVLTDPERQTGIALIMVDEETAQNEILVVPGACGHFREDDIRRVRPLIENAAVLLTQLEVNLDAVCRVIDIARAAGVPVVLNPAPAQPLPDGVLSKVEIITPNETEAAALTGVSVKTEADAARAARVFLSKGIQKVVITMGAMGAFCADGARSEMLPPIPVAPLDTTGAGDAFNGALAMALAEGKDLFTALRFGNAAGALCVTRLGAAPSMPTRSEIIALVRKTYGIE